MSHNEELSSSEKLWFSTYPSQKWYAGLWTFAIHHLNWQQASFVYKSVFADNDLWKCAWAPAVLSVTNPDLFLSNTTWGPEDHENQILTFSFVLSAQFSPDFWNMLKILWTIAKINQLMCIHWRLIIFWCLLILTFNFPHIDLASWPKLLGNSFSVVLYLHYRLYSILLPLSILMHFAAIKLKIFFPLSFPIWNIWCFQCSTVNKTWMYKICKSL